MRSGLAATALCAALAACASAWRLEDVAGPPPDAVPRVEPCRAVAAAVISTPRGDLEAIVYLARPAAGRVRAHLTTDSALTILDVEVDGAAERVHAQSELGRLPGLLPAVSGDLRRLLGDRSVFSADAASGARRVIGDAQGRVALELPEGSWAVVSAAELTPASPLLHVTLLDRSRVPEAEIVYEDPGPEGLPRTLRLTDLADGHSMTLDVHQVLGDQAADAR